MFLQDNAKGVRNNGEKDKANLEFLLVKAEVKGVELWEGQRSIQGFLGFWRREITVYTHQFYMAKCL